MDTAGKRALVERFFSGTGPTYDLVVRLATLGIDPRWKRTIIDYIPEGATRVLDLACGTGILTLEIARRFPEARVVGVELREEYLSFARKKVASHGVRNVELVHSAAEDYHSHAPFDAVVSSYLAKYAELDRLTRHTAAMLRPGGLVLMHDFTYPTSRALVTTWRAYLGLLRIAGTPLLPAWREIFAGLASVIERTRWTDELIGALEAGDFQKIQMRYLTARGSAIVSAFRPAASGPAQTTPSSSPAARHPRPDG